MVVNNVKLYEKIKKLRLDNHMTQKELAKKLGISIPTLQKYEYGDYKIKNEIIVKMSEIFNVPIEELLSISDNDTDVDKKIKYKEIKDIKKDNSRLWKIIRDIINDTPNSTNLVFSYPILGFLSSLLDFKFKYIEKMIILKFENEEIKISEENLKKILKMMENDIGYNFSKYLNIFGKIEKIENEEENSEKDSD